MRRRGEAIEDKSPDQLADLGRRLLMESATEVDSLEVLAERAERSSRKVVILQPRAGYLAYRDMLHLYGVRNLLDCLSADPQSGFALINESLAVQRWRDWVNVGGQLIRSDELEMLLLGIEGGQYRTWHAIHRVFDSWWARYPYDKQQHAVGSLASLLALDRPLSVDQGLGTTSMSPDQWHAVLDRGVQIQRYVAEAVYRSRKKDDEDPFRQMVYGTPEEMAAVLGRAEDNSFVRQVREETQAFVARVEEIRRRG